MALQPVQMGKMAGSLPIEPGIDDRRDVELRVLTGYLLRRVVSLANPGVTASLAELGLRRVLFSALTVVVNHPGLKQSELADVLAVERSNMVKIVDELVQSGLISRQRRDGDQRAYALIATEVGTTLQRQAFARVIAFDKTLTRGVNDADLETFLKVLASVETNVLEGGQ